MSNPRHYLYLTIVYLIVVAGVCGLLFQPLKAAFMANWGFNLLIFAALVVGIAINLFQIIRLEPEIKWIKIFRTGDPGLSVTEPSLLLSPWPGIWRKSTGTGSGFRPAPCGRCWTASGTGWTKPGRIPNI